jgi:hypothetical protein
MMVVVGIAGVAVAGNDTMAITENGNLTIPFYRTRSLYRVGNQIFCCYIPLSAVRKNCALYSRFTIQARKI